MKRYLRRGKLTELTASGCNLRKYINLTVTFIILYRAVVFSKGLQCLQREMKFFFFFGSDNGRRGYSESIGLIRLMYFQAQNIDRVVQLSKYNVSYVVMLAIANSTIPVSSGR